MKDYVVVPTTGEKLYDSALISLPGYPDQAFVLHRGYYPKNDFSVYGWYCRSQTTGIILAITPDLLSACTVLRAGVTQSSLPSMIYVSMQLSEISSKLDAIIDVVTTVVSHAVLDDNPDSGD